MTQQQLQSNIVNGDWRGSKLPGILAGDVAAAAISATAISPLITAIDRAVVENAASSSRPLLSTLKSHVICSFRHPRQFFAAKPFFYVWTLYAATYTTANGVESVAKEITTKADQVLVSTVTFLATCAVNVPLGVWKDVRFVQLYGRPTTPKAALNTPLQKGATASATAPSPVPTARFPRIVGATFLFRDAITIFGSINLPPMLTSSIPDSIFSSPAIKMAAMQIFTPVLSQVFATPIHLLGLDLYSNPHSSSAERMSRMRRSLGPTTAMRCSRIIPAFGVGLVLNTGLRDYFHGKVGAAATN
ncbi:uncharacterized protein K460DRAFT_391902 [Cucurbitaria berberidis CBS 394.84]|uniref:Sequence orphan n=1 Tax=Cucurbitaria berberidis CBS 394.84 TaxID=1168544 RepID=A0A9P4GUC3_9PLEO|nr:uncharacterized protein K460DRAFT_391902 [Cucurbitaria berberidis CBS 394.84]KAF1851669.1 hypothetical protein K460DRAFT_391902 [Cucurbitaria berberidis CBS 394.84]